MHRKTTDDMMGVKRAGDCGPGKAKVRREVRKAIFPKEPDRLGQEHLRPGTRFEADRRLVLLLVGRGEIRRIGHRRHKERGACRHIRLELAVGKGLTASQRTLYYGHFQERLEDWHSTL